jgi:ABC-2 type transport system permease protein
VIGFWAILKRELWSLWVTPLAWVLLFVFLGLQGTSFYLLVEHFSKSPDLGLNEGPIQSYFASLFVPVSLLLVCPALSMRVFADERRQGTLETLLTAPVSALSVVLGKYCATLFTYWAMWLPTLLYVVILRDSGVVDWGLVGSSYLGVALLGAAYLAVGTLMSALTQSQLVAMLLTTLTLFGLFILGIGERVFDPGPLLDVSSHVSVLGQLEDFSKGVVDSRRLVFDATLIWFPLFLCVRIVDGWRLD